MKGNLSCLKETLAVELSSTRLLFKETVCAIESKLKLLSGEEVWF